MVFFPDSCVVEIGRRVYVSSKELYDDGVAESDFGEVRYDL